MTNIPLKTLYNGVSVPQLGLGVYKVPPEDVYQTVSSALKAGYRHIDTASYYENENGVGKAIKDSGIPREKLFITTKVWNDDHGYDRTLQAFEKSMEKLNMDYVDLYLIHWPIPEIFPETWKALEKLYKDGRVKAIGVSNFLDHHLQTLLTDAKIKPVVNQIELHPKLIQKQTVEFCRENDIAVESWSPLGRARYLDDVILEKLAKKYDKTVAQIMIRWHIQHDFIVIPKSTKAKRQAENMAVFDFELSPEDMKQIDGMDEGFRIGSHPDEIMNK
ncbi:diketogulonate reductase-like aldo/keto reductase [Virgibacillus campisalis]|uniref:Diketogulonate reductase-like aldo/keto reductase n=2 Tax=Virgibacillus alimentarius TaxID=698769 RepID=A0ABS4SBA0_9BACI|nr:aldo/keto reductase [Virgibacillus alimentarius]MBP2258765.1 diketogulonate reductase-like aldo/keto reductase [Virgibacillus alimentarius]